MATIGNLGGYVAPYAMGLARDATGRVDYGLYLMAAAMILGALLVRLLPRNATIDEIEQVPVLTESPAIGAT